MNPLLSFIKSQLESGNNRETITKMLLGQGWTMVDIDQAFGILNSSNIPVPPPISIPSPSSSIAQNQPSSVTSVQKKGNTGIIIGIIIFLLLIGVGVYTYITYFSKPNIIAPVVTENIPAKAISETDELWSVFEELNSALKNADVKAYNSVSYTPIPSDQVEQFSKIAPFLYLQSKDMKEADFVNKWKDDKQAIYSTIPKRFDDADSYSYNQSLIFFIKEKDSSWKVLSLNLEKGSSILKKGTNNTPAQIEQSLQEMIIDSDKDGIADQDEVCGGAEQYNSKCVKTDKNNRDTNGNGWWDGIEEYIKVVVTKDVVKPVVQNEVKKDVKAVKPTTKVNSPVQTPVVLNNPDLITFDDLKPTDKTGGYVTSGIINDGYRGFKWNYADKGMPSYKNNFIVIDGGSATIASGYRNAVISAKNAIACTEVVCTISSETPFNLKSFYVTAAWNDNLDFNVQGYGPEGGTICGNSSSIKNINAVSPQLVTVNCEGVSMINFWANEIGSTIHPGYNHDSSDIFVIDNISLK